MKELRAAISKLRERASLFTSLADALSRLGRVAKTVRASRGGKRKISRAGRTAISRAQKRRWLRYRKANGAK